MRFEIVCSPCCMNEIKTCVTRSSFMFSTSDCSLMCIQCLHMCTSCRNRICSIHIMHHILQPTNTHVHMCSYTIHKHIHTQEIRVWELAGGLQGSGYITCTIRVSLRTAAHSNPSNSHISISSHHSSVLLQQQLQLDSRRRATQSAVAPWCIALIQQSSTAAGTAAAAVAAVTAVATQSQSGIRSYSDILVQGGGGCMRRLTPRRTRRYTIAHYFTLFHTVLHCSLYSTAPYHFKASEYNRAFCTALC
jgi:hypothetical protein